MRSSENKAIIAGALTGDGSIRQLENRFRRVFENRMFYLSVMNATCGLAAVLRCLPPGKVLCPLFTAPATFAAIKQAGHTVGFCDIDPLSLCLSPETVLARLDGDVRAILYVNIFGHCCDLQGLRKLADEAGIMLIVDAAQSLATCLNNPATTGIADAVVFSLGPQKLTHCADGGIIAVKSPPLWQELVRQTQHPFRQVLDVVDRLPNLEHYNNRINPFSAGQALLSLQNIKKRIAALQRTQRRILRQLAEFGLQDTVSSNRDTVFQPLTVFVKKNPLPERFLLSGLPIPDLSVQANKHNLPETLRQYKYRRVVEVRGD